MDPVLAADRALPWQQLAIEGTGAKLRRWMTDSKRRLVNTGKILIESIEVQPCSF
jgi:hypothetical protein